MDVTFREQMITHKKKKEHKEICFDHQHNYIDVVANDDLIAAATGIPDRWK